VVEVDLVALGHPGWPPPSSNWDWWPLLGIALALFVATRSLGLQISIPVIAVAIAVGPCFATVVHAWGVGPALVVVFAVRWVVVRARLTGRGRNPPRPV
jgi:hypothetical protein